MVSPRHIAGALLLAGCSCGRAAVVAVDIRGDCPGATVQVGGADICPGTCAITTDHAITVEAKTPLGCSFDGFTGACTTSEECRLSRGMVAPLHATFHRNAWPLHLSVVGSGVGQALVSTPEQSSCTDACDVLVPVGHTAELTAVPDAGATFQWGADCAGIDGGTCRLPGDRERTALLAFSNPAFDVLTLSIVGSGQVSIAVPTQLCSAPQCAVMLEPGSVVQMHASASPGWRFDKWTAPGCGTAVDCDVVVNSDTAVAALFVKTWTVAIDFTGDGGGTVTQGMSSCNAGCQFLVDEGPITLAASAAAGAEFERWSGACTGRQSGCSLVVASDVSVVADFAQVVGFLRGYPDEGKLEVSRAIADDAGAIYSTGAFVMSGTFADAGIIVASGSTDVFAAKQDSSGRLVWLARSNNTSGAITGLDLALRADGSLVVVGTMSGTVNLGSANFTNQASQRQLLLFAVATDGGILQSDAIENSPPGAPRLWTDTLGATYLVGPAEGPILVRNSAFAPLDAGSDDSFILKFDSQLAPVSGRVFNGFQPVIAPLLDGGIAAFASFPQSIDFGCGPYTAPGTRGVYNPLAAVGWLDSSLNCTAATYFQAPLDSLVFAEDVTATDEGLLLLFVVRGTATAFSTSFVGAPAGTNQPIGDLFLAEVSSGGLLWSQHVSFDAGSDPFASGFATFSGAYLATSGPRIGVGAVVSAASFSTDGGTAVCPGVPVPGTDFAFLTFSRSGQPEWSACWGTANPYEYPISLAPYPPDDFLLTGQGNGLSALDGLLVWPQDTSTTQAHNFVMLVTPP